MKHLKTYEGFSLNESKKELNPDFYSQLLDKLEKYPELYDDFIEGGKIKGFNFWIKKQLQENGIESTKENIQKTRRGILKQNDAWNE